MIQCTDCVFHSKNGEVHFCLAVADLLYDEALCKGRLFRQSDDSIPREEDLTSALEELRDAKI